MAENEKFDIAKWFSGFGNPVTWSKSIVTFVMIIVFLFLGVTVYRAYFRKTNIDNVNKPEFNVASGGQVTYQNIQNIQDTKKSLARVIPYIDVNTGYMNGRDKYFSSDYGWEAKAGVKVEFDGLFDMLFIRKSVTQDQTSAVSSTNSHTNKK